MSGSSAGDSSRYATSSRRDSDRRDDGKHKHKHKHKHSMSSASLSSSASNMHKDGHGLKSKGKLLGKVTDWFSTSEPSLQALKQYRTDVYSRAGVAQDDPDAHAKLHAPIGEIPGDAIKARGRGPEPEEVARKKSEMRRQMRALHDMSLANTSRSSSDCPTFA